MSSYSDKKYSIYLLCSMQGYLYVGRTSNLKQRIKSHLSIPPNPVFRSEINTFGKDSVIVKELDSNLSLSDASVSERDVIVSAMPHYITNRSIPMAIKPNN